MESKKHLKVLSLFDGISGAKQALKELNIDCEYFASEIDKYARQIAEANHPDIRYIGDVKNSTIFKCVTKCGLGKVIINGVFLDFDDFDLLIGGSPCQNLSIAGNRKGLKGDQSSLFYEYVRILNEVKPKYFILENVASMKKEEQEKMTSELFNIEPIMINSSLVTAQQRKRLYWIGRLKENTYEQIKISQPKDENIYLKDIIEKGFVDREKSYCIDANYHKGGNLKSYFEKGRRQLVFNKPFRIGHFNKGGQGDRVYSIDGKSVCLSALSGGKGAKTGLYETEKDYIRKLTVQECCRLQGFPNDYFQDKSGYEIDKQLISNTQAYKCLGNSFTVPVIKHILKTIKKGK